MSSTTLEKRLSAVESQVEALAHQVGLLSGRTSNPNWVQQVAGSMKGFPEFAEVLQIIRENRERELAEFDKSAKKGASKRRPSRNGAAR